MYIYVQHSKLFYGAIRAINKKNASLFWKKSNIPGKKKFSRTLSIFRMKFFRYIFSYSFSIIYNYIMYNQLQTMKYINFHQNFPMTCAEVIKKTYIKQVSFQLLVWLCKFQNFLWFTVPKIQKSIFRVSKVDHG